MCGRYVFNPGDDFYGRWQVDEGEMRLKTDYNVAPGMIMPVITKEDKRQLSEMKWGLIPFWSKDAKIGFKTFNARAEDIANKPSFRRPFKNSRCLIPASGFYEWGVINGEKKPYYFQLKSGEMFAFAGLYDTWKDVEQRPIKTFTIITVTANRLVKPIHERMPAILQQEDEDIWADNQFFDGQKLVGLLKSFGGELLQANPVR